MAEIIKFPGRFNRPDDEEKKIKKEPVELTEQEKETSTRSSEEEAAETKPIVLTPEKREEISQVLGAFHKKMEAIKNSNPGILWSGNQAREMDKIVKTYAAQELISWIWNVDDKVILAKPLFFNAIAYEMARRGLVPDKKKGPEETK